MKFACACCNCARERTARSERATSCGVTACGKQECVVVLLNVIALADQTRRLVERSVIGSSAVV